jgi:multiple sugar transport system permease protein
VHAWRLFPFGVVIFLAGFTSVPQDVLDAATIDGAGFWRRNYQIILPIIAPIIMIRDEGGKPIFEPEWRCSTS